MLLVQPTLSSQGGIRNVKWNNLYQLKLPHVSIFLLFILISAVAIYFPRNGINFSGIILVINSFIYIFITVSINYLNHINKQKKNSSINLKNSGKYFHIINDGKMILRVSIPVGVLGIEG